MKHPRQPGVPHPGAPVYLCYGSTEPDLKCSQNHQGVARPGGCLHSGGNAAWGQRTGLWSLHILFLCCSGSSEIMTTALRLPVMCVTAAGFIQGKQLFQLTKREMSLHILLLINHTAAQCLLVALPLKDLLLYGSSLEVG